MTCIFQSHFFFGFLVFGDLQILLEALWILLILAFFTLATSGDVSPAVPHSVSVELGSKLAWRAICISISDSNYSAHPKPSISEVSFWISSEPKSKLEPESDSESSTHWKSWLLVSLNRAYCTLTGTASKFTLPSATSSSWESWVISISEWFAILWHNKFTSGRLIKIPWIWAKCWISW